MANILVIDDSPTVRLSVRAALRPHGHEVFDTDQILALPRFLAEHEIDLVLLDLQMPWSGFGVGAFLKQYDARQTRLAIYSAKPLRELQAAAQRLGAVGVIEKDRPGLAEKVDRLLK